VDGGRLDGKTRAGETVVGEPWVWQGGGSNQRHPAAAAVWIAVHGLKLTTIGDYSTRLSPISVHKHFSNYSNFAQNF
jgi:hypothetical protein